MSLLYVSLHPSCYSSNSCLWQLSFGIFKISLCTVLSLLSILSILSNVQAARVLPNDLITLLKIFHWGFDGFRKKKKKSSPRLSFSLPLSTLELELELPGVTYCSPPNDIFSSASLHLAQEAFLDTECTSSLLKWSLKCPQRFGLHEGSSIKPSPVYPTRAHSSYFQWCGLYI